MRMPATMSAYLLTAMLMSQPLVAANDEQSSALQPEAEQALPTETIYVPLETIIGSFVEALGSDDYQLRERATELLHRIGPSAQAALEKAAESDNAECRRRCERLLGDLRIGVSGDWPAGLALLARHYDRLDEGARIQAIDNIADALQHRAAHFLVMRLSGPQATASAAVAAAMRTQNGYLAREMGRLLSSEAENEHRRQILEWAERYINPPLDAGLLLEDMSQHLKVTLTETIKEQRLAEYQKAMAEANLRIALTTDRAASFLRMLDEPTVTVAYDAVAGGIRFETGGKAMGATVKLPSSPGKPTLVAIESADCIYIYSIDADNGKALRLDRFEKDYALKAAAEGPLLDSTMHSTVDKATVAWDKLAGGYILDQVTDKLSLEIEATFKDGRRANISIGREQIVVEPAETAELPETPPADTSDAPSAPVPAPQPPEDDPQLPDVPLPGLPAPPDIG